MENDPKFRTAKLAYARAKRDQDLAQILGDPDAIRLAEEKEADAHQRLVNVAESLRKVK